MNAANLFYFLFLLKTVNGLLKYQPNDKCESKRIKNVS